MIFRDIEELIPNQGKEGERGVRKRTVITLCLCTPSASKPQDPLSSSLSVMILQILNEFRNTGKPYLHFFTSTKTDKGSRISRPEGSFFLERKWAGRLEWADL